MKKAIGPSREGEKAMRKNSGFSLVEMMIALFLVSISVLALGTHVAATMSANLRSKLATEANTLIQDKLEALKKVPFDSLASGGDSVTAYGMNFVRSWTVSDLDNLKKIDLKIDYGSRSISVSTFRTREV
jgi:prepilin-type N-terminal cleavage/methylation domain-containing protein